MYTRVDIKTIVNFHKERNGYLYTVTMLKVSLSSLPRCLFCFAFHTHDKLEKVKICCKRMLGNSMYLFSSHDTNSKLSLYLQII